MADEPLIRAQRIAAGKGAASVFEALSFDIAPGSFTALVGPNGAGKTSLFETLLGLVPLRAGKLTVMGGRPRRARRYVAYVPQASKLLNDNALIGREFVSAAYHAHRWGMPLPFGLRHQTQAVDEALETVEARDLARRRLSTLSGGQRQRLLIAQALVSDPSLILFDEPLSQLDPAARDRVVSVADVLTRRGIAVIFSTHDVNPVLRVCDQVLYLAGGRGRAGRVDEIICDRTLSELYGTPMRVISEEGRRFVFEGSQRRLQAVGQ
ncbi:ATP-binding cassette domain-containing protein [Salinicola corii]|uniref:ATP-binding cassette domain-containing protein n=1 Tax=Salinicola corii TaxID=2606937 RepID=A0A640W9Y7_9GAMM|nr:ATP-binding cassette domain-containing protein [Salinicola corii]KAA0015285.1 ATP-binding cassette domain-containing protein [Salinicola corii]